MNKTILIVENENTAMLFKALLKLDGYSVETAQSVVSEMEHNCQYSLLITTDRYIMNNYDRLKDLRIPFLVLSSSVNPLYDHIIRSLRHTYILSRPVDFNQLRNTVKRVIDAK